MFRKALSITLYSFKQWKTDIRIWLMFVCMYIFVWNDFSCIEIFANMIEIQANSLIFPFFSSDVVKQLIILSGIVFLYADIPFVNSTYPYVIVRSKRIAWVWGKIGYIILSSGIYFVVIMGGSVLMTMPYATVYFDDWGKIIYTLAETNAGSLINLQFGVSQKIVNNYTPLYAFVLTFLLNWCVGMFMGLMMFWVSIKYNRMIGLLTGAIILFWDLLVINTLPYSFYYISPVTLSRLGVLDPIGITMLPDISYVFFFFGSSIVGLCILLRRGMNNKVFKTY